MKRPAFFTRTRRAWKALGRAGRLRVAIAALVLLTIPPALVRSRPNHVSTGTVLEGPGADGSWFSETALADVGEPISIGTSVWAARQGGPDIVIRSVKLAGVHGLHLVGITANGPDRQLGGIGAVPGFPPRNLNDDPVPIPGAVVITSGPHQRQGVAMTFGVMRNRAGRGYATGYDVVYAIGGALRHQHFAMGFTVCAITGYTRGVTPSQPCKAAPRPN